MQSRFLIMEEPDHRASGGGYAATHRFHRVSIFAPPILTNNSFSGVEILKLAGNHGDKSGA